MEIIEELIDWPGYGVDRLGNVYSRRKPGNGFVRLYDHWKKLKPHKNHRGYLKVTLRKNGKTVTRKIHHLVLKHFVGPCPKGMQCLHGPDQDKSNNSLDNLRWGTARENYDDSLRFGTTAHGVKNGHEKLNDKKVIAIRKLAKTGLSYREIANRFGVCIATVCCVVLGETWRRVKEK